jgi:multidrug resistance efflux pump
MSEAVERALPTPRRSPRRRLLRVVGIPVLLVVVLIGASVGFSMYQEGQRYVSTDNAQVSGQPIQVGSANSGRVAAVRVKIGDRVSKGELLAQVDLPSQVGIAQNGQPRFEFLGNADTRVEVQSPIDGMVIATPGAVGSTVVAGQAVVVVVDPSQLWVNANIDETSISRLRVGQPASVHVDALGSDVPGMVEAITPATAATFSLLPSNSGSGSFNKVAQLVPVRIRVAVGTQPALLGTSAEVKIRVAE